jgi:single-stranded DNA-binding protein
MTVSVNVVVLAGTIAADPVERRMPSGEECTEIRLSVPEPGRRLLPLPVVAWHGKSGRSACGTFIKGTRCSCTRG